MTDAELRKLVELRDRQPALAEILRRVHFGELPTIYPPTSQAVFATATVTTPPDASVLTRMVIMKSWLIVFDLATLGLVIALFFDFVVTWVEFVPWLFCLTIGYEIRRKRELQAARSTRTTSDLPTLQ